MQLRRNVVRQLVLIFLAIVIWTILAGQSTFMQVYPLINGRNVTQKDLLVSADNHYYLINTIDVGDLELPAPVDIACCIDSTGVLEWTIGGVSDSTSHFFAGAAMFEKDGALHNPVYNNGQMTVEHWQGDGSYSVSYGDSLPFSQGYSLDGFKYNDDYQVAIVSQVGPATLYLICFNAEGDTLWTRAVPDSITNCSAGMRLDAGHLIFMCTGANNHPLVYTTDNQGNGVAVYDYTSSTSYAVNFRLFSNEMGRVLVGYNSDPALMHVDLFQNNAPAELFTITPSYVITVQDVLLDGSNVLYSDWFGLKKVDLAGSFQWILNMPEDWYGTHTAGKGLMTKTPDNCYLWSLFTETGFGLIKCTLDSTIPVSDNLVTVPDIKLVTYPNPFKDNLTLSFELKKAQSMEIQVYNIKGQLIKRLSGIEGYAGFNKVLWDGNDNNDIKAAQGVYLIKAQVEGKETIKRVIKLK